MPPAPDPARSRPCSLPALQDLPPRDARLCLDVGRFCRRELGLASGAHLLLALSGGADSTALAVLLTLLAPRMDLRLSALSVDHGLRPESREETRQVCALCRDLGIACAVRRADAAVAAAAWGCGLEEAGRKVRYALLEEERAALNADWILLGHHAGDLSEDVLLRLTRGAGWPGLAGMAPRDDARRLLRPLLFTAPEALRALLLRLGIHWSEDASNASPDYRRNRLRHEVLPLLRRENPALDRGFATLHRLGSLDGDFWEETLDRALAAHPWQSGTENGAPAVTLPRGLLAALHPAARLRLYVRVCRALRANNSARGGGTGGQPRAATLLALDAALREGRGNTRFQLPGALEALVRGGCVRFTAVQPSRSKASAASVTPRTSRP